MIIFTKLLMTFFKVHFAYVSNTIFEIIGHHVVFEDILYIVTLDAYTDYHNFSALHLVNNLT